MGDHAFCLGTVIESTYAAACEAEPSTGAERAVLQAMIGAMRSLCRMHGRAAAAAVLPPDPGASPSAATVRSRAGARLGARVRGCDARLIGDLYYRLAEYRRSRSLAADPCGLPLSMQLADDKKAAVMEALTPDNRLYGDTGIAARRPDAAPGTGSLF